MTSWAHSAALAGERPSPTSWSRASMSPSPRPSPWSVERNRSALALYGADGWPNMYPMRPWPAAPRACQSAAASGLTYFLAPALYSLIFTPA